MAAITTSIGDLDLLPSFQVLHNRYEISGELVTQTGLRVGAGKRSDMAATDQPVMRDGLDRPFIPGTSLKGVLRCWLERLLRGLEREKGLWACDLFSAKDRCLPDDREQRRSRTLEEITKDSCSACALFGSPSIAGRVYFRDLALKGGSTEFVTEVRDGVGIDRELGTAAPKIKYDTEVVQPGARFGLALTLENARGVDLALLQVALDALHRGEILLGGMTTRGLGQVMLENLALQRSDARDLLLGRSMAVLSWADQLETSRKLLAKRLGG